VTRTITYTEEAEVMGVSADMVSGGGFQLTLRFRSVRRDAAGALVDYGPEQKEAFIIGTDLSVVSKAAVDAALNLAISNWRARKYGP
jgi:hypothetical protein